MSNAASTVTDLTTKEISVLRAMKEILSEDRIPFTMDVGELTGLRPVALGGVFASLSKKGLAWSDNTGPTDERCFAMRPEGFAALRSTTGAIQAMIGELGDVIGEAG